MSWKCMLRVCLFRSTIFIQINFISLFLCTVEVQGRKLFSLVKNTTLEYSFQGMNSNILIKKKK